MSLKDLIGENIAFIVKYPLNDGTTTFIEDGKIASIVDSDETLIVFDGVKYEINEFRLYCLNIEEPNDEFLEGMRKLLHSTKGTTKSGVGMFVRHWFNDNGYSPIKEMNSILVKGKVTRSYKK